MAKVRIGFSTQFELENELVGIGTDNPTNTLQALGNIRSSDAKAVGVTTLTTFDGFTDTKLSLQGSGGAKQGTTSGEIIIEGSVDVSTGATFRSGPENLAVTDNFTLPGISDDKPSVGTFRFNENLGSLEFYTGTEWRAVNSYSRGNAAGRAVIAKGNTPSSPNGESKEMGYLNISSLGNSTNFGELTAGRFLLSRVSSETRGMFAGGDPGPSSVDIIDYITIASEGNAIDFGNLLSSGRCAAGASSSTRGLFLGENASNVISYVEISTTGNALDFGDLSAPGSPGSKGTGTSSPTRYIHYSGSNSPSERIDFGTIASKGNSVRFGNHIIGGYSHEGARQNRACSNQTRAVFAGGYVDISPYPVQSLMATITMASEGNAIAFGDLTVARYGVNTTSNQVRGIFAGGGALPGFFNVIDYINFASSGNATDFGDMEGRVGNAVSDSHGGLGGF